MTYRTSLPLHPTEDDNKQQKIISKTGNRLEVAKGKGKDKKVKRLNEKLKKQVSQSVRGLGIRYSPRKLG